MHTLGRCWAISVRTAISAAVLFGDRLGLFNALREGGKMTADELTARTGTQERLVREWLSGQAAAGYIEYEAADWFYLSPEQELVCADETSPACRGDEPIWLSKPETASRVRGRIEAVIAAARADDDSRWANPAR
jgi:hypothetical protein